MLHRNPLLFLAALGLLLPEARQAQAQEAAAKGAASLANAIVLSRPALWQAVAFPDWLVDVPQAVRHVPVPRPVAAPRPAPSASAAAPASPKARSRLRLSAAFGFSSPHLSSPYMAVSTDIIGAERKGDSLPVRFSGQDPYHLPEPFPQAGREVGVNIGYSFQQTHGLSGLALTGRFALLAPDLYSPYRGRLGIVALKLDF
jgi:hypothetical protein